MGSAPSPPPSPPTAPPPPSAPPWACPCPAGPTAREGGGRCWSGRRRRGIPRQWRCEVGRGRGCTCLFGCESFWALIHSFTSTHPSLPPPKSHAHRPGGRPPLQRTGRQLPRARPQRRVPPGGLLPSAGTGPFEWGVYFLGGGSGMCPCLAPHAYVHAHNTHTPLTSKPFNDDNVTQINPNRAPSPPPWSTPARCRSGASTPSASSTAATPAGGARWVHHG